MSPHFTFIELEQGSPEWRAWRHNGIGGSEASTVMGHNPFKSAEQLRQEKRAPVQDFTPNAAMMRGTQLEPEARRRYVALRGVDFRPVCLQSTHHDWLRASLDGLAITDDAAVEIKCGRSVYRKTYQYKSVPRYYYEQLQHILAVTNLNEIDFWCHWPGCPDLRLTVKRNDNYISRLLQMEWEFWSSVEVPSL